MHMVGHQAVRVKRQAVLFGFGLQHVEVSTPIVVDKENVLSVVSRCVTWWGKCGMTIRAVRGMFKTITEWCNTC